MRFPAELVPTRRELNAERELEELIELERLEELGLPLTPPLTPEDEERLVALMTEPEHCGAAIHPRHGGPPEQCALLADHEEPCEP